MAYKMFAAIYVGSSEISMKIFQVNGRKTFRQIDSVSRILELGRDTYREGKLSRESIKMICEELEGLKHKMKNTRSQNTVPMRRVRYVRQITWIWCWM